MRDSPDRQYTKEWLQIDRPQPMYDNGINRLYSNIYQKNPVDSADIVNDFKKVFLEFLKGHTLSNLRGYDNFERLDICMGCTQFIDDLYQRLGPTGLMIWRREYKYHWRLNPDLVPTKLDTFDPKKELLISMPFSFYGDVHPRMTEILDRCAELEIPVHIDGAYITCSRDVDFDFDHPAIKTFAISLSKGGLGPDRVALRFARSKPEGAITIMNDFNMVSQSLLNVGIAFMKELGPEYFWRKYGGAYEQVCKDFELLPTKSIHLARTQDGEPVGIRPLLRCLVK